MILSQSDPIVPVWKKSSRCDATDCVEVAWHAEGVAVRDNTRPDVNLTFDPASWTGLLAGLHADRLRG